MNNNNIKMTIITVTYNCELIIDMTMQSVLEQNYDNIEYILVDGASNDSTLKIIESYAKENKNIKYISEKDDGIYDAMNKGIKMAKGEAIFFLNAGDVFFDNEVINKIAKEFSNSDYDIIYGDVLFLYKKRNFLQKIRYVNSFKLVTGTVICHQGIFAKRIVFEKYGYFDLKYKICSDLNWFVNCYINGVLVNHLNIVISKFDTNGISNRKDTLGLRRREKEDILNNYYSKPLSYIIKIRHLLGKIKHAITSS